jgi:uncharacterized protein YcgL (UPF0745 family)
MKVICSIYKTTGQDEMYLYVDKKEQFARVPASLMERFAKPELVCDILLHAEKKLARANVEEVLKHLQNQGYYLQMPPEKDRSLLTLLKPK